MRSRTGGYVFTYPFFIAVTFLGAIMFGLLFAILTPVPLADSQELTRPSTSILAHGSEQAHAAADRAVQTITTQQQEAAKIAEEKKQQEEAAAAAAKAQQAATQAVTATATTPTITTTQAASTPYSLTYAGVASDLRSIGYSQAALRSMGIEVIGHNGGIPKRCVSGPNGSLYTQGIAIKTPYTYRTCPDGGSPLYDAYRPAGYSCSVIYNRSSSKRLAILAHEVAHCIYFKNGQYKIFDIQYKTVRSVSSLTRSQMNEIIADDIMICVNGLDTNWGSGSYYVRYGVSRPTAAQCNEIRSLYSAIRAPA